MGLRSIRDGHLKVCPKDTDNGLSPYCTLECCAKNRGAYAWEFALQNPQAEFQFLACIGANSSTVASYQAVPYLRTNTDLVTITVGGDNGNAFAQLVKHCVYFRENKNCTAAFANARDVLQYARSNLTYVLNAIRKQAPLAQINVLGYVQFFNASGTHCQNDFLKHVSLENKTEMNSLVRQVNGNSSLAITAWNALYPKSVPAAFIDVDPAFASNRLCDPTPYFQWEIVNFTIPGVAGPCGQGNDVWPWTGVFHPNELGQKAYLNTLSASLRCQSGTFRNEL